MDSSPLTPENVSSLIDHVMKSKDPANVGLRRILKKKEDESNSFQLHAPVMKEFDTPGVKAHHFSEDDKIILDLEKKVSDLQIKLKKTEEHSKTASKEAFENGRDEGFKNGVKKATEEAAIQYDKQIAEVQEKISLLIKSVETEKREIFANAEHILLKLTFEIVKKIIACEITSNKEYILGIIKKSIAYIADKERMILRVSPSDFEVASKRKDFWLPVTERINDITIESDERIKSGGCIIESNTGNVDARLGVQFDDLAGLVEKIWESVNAPDQE